MLDRTPQSAWNEFLLLVKKKCSPVEFQNWLEPIHMQTASKDELVLSVPNIFVQEYLIDNFSSELKCFFEVNQNEIEGVSFVIEQQKPVLLQEPETTSTTNTKEKLFHFKLNKNYTFDNFIEGPSNQFVKSAALGVANHPGKSYNPLFIYGGVGLGKTHLLHSIAHHISQHHKKRTVHCITTEGFINDLVHSLKNKTVDKLKRFYRSLDVLIVDDIQFLQSRLNFEEEFCQMFESLINQGKQVIISSDQPPSQLKLSERLVARMEWGLVAGIGMPDLETRVAIIQHKSEDKGIALENDLAFYIAENVSHNVRQLEGAINRLTAYCRLMKFSPSKKVIEDVLTEVLTSRSSKKITVDEIMQNVCSVFNVKVSELRGTSRSKDIALPRQVAMYLAKELLNDSLVKLASAFGGKTHSTLLHSWNKIRHAMQKDERLSRQIAMTKQNIST